MEGGQGLDGVGLLVCALAAVRQRPGVWTSCVGQSSACQATCLSRCLHARLPACPGDPRNARPPPGQQPGMQGSPAPAEGGHKVEPLLEWPQTTRYPPLLVIMRVTSVCVCLQKHSCVPVRSSSAQALMHGVQHEHCAKLKRAELAEGLSACRSSARSSKLPAQSSTCSVEFTQGLSGGCA